MEKGGISVSTEHIFPIIKRWLYSDKDIFVREVVSNACDAITKHRRLVSLGEAAESISESDYRINIRIDKDARTITFTDNGIGMSESELKQYINQIALSGALDFISKYEGENSGGNGIIGHFGLGFYSVFMVAERVELNTKSYTDAVSVHWECDEAGQFSMSEGSRSEQGTEIILHISENESGYLDSVKFRSILDKYCAFMPYEIHFDIDGKSEVINDTKPLWQRSPSEVTEEEYKEFYKKVFADYREPLFWVHINADYPLNFKGILYFPAQRSDFEPLDCEIKLFYNSVFVADNIKEACPDFLLNLKGVLDCPELPLNVSRSYLQNNVYIKKVSEHVAKKVADRLNSMFNTERESYEKIWDGIKPFIEYGCMRNDKFFERVGDIVLLKKHSGGFATLAEYTQGKDDAESTVYYATDAAAQSYYIELFRGKEQEVVLCDMLIDANYLQFLEGKNKKIKFLRVDADFAGINDNTEGADNSGLEELFKESSGKDKLEVKFVALGENDAPGLITVSEESRRMADMMKAYRMGGTGGTEFPVEEILTVNTNAPLVKSLSILLASGDQKEKAELLAKHIYLSALLLSRRLTPAETADFIGTNNSLLMNI